MNSLLQSGSRNLGLIISAGNSNLINLSFSVLHARLLLSAILGRRKTLLLHGGSDGIVAGLEDSELGKNISQFHPPPMHDISTKSHLLQIWTPDTFFLNGKKSKMHKITVPNRFARIKPDGRVSFSQRLTIKATCPMGLKKYPFDNQVHVKSFVSHFGWATRAVRVTSTLIHTTNDAIVCPGMPLDSRKLWVSIRGPAL